MFNTTTRGKIILLITPLLVLVAGATIAKPPAEFTVHEWGTFLVMNGSDGVTLDGMYHEEHSLPGFVHARSKDQLRVPAGRDWPTRAGSPGRRPLRARAHAVWPPVCPGITNAPALAAAAGRSRAGRGDAAVCSAFLEHRRRD